jgi:hypothetical protein
MTPDDLRANMLSTYFSLRAGLVLLSFTFPVVFLAYSLYAHGALTEDSISAFCRASGAPGWVRNYFVATLCAIGSLLVMYRGFGTLENWLLNVAGVCAIFVAFVPCHCWDGVTPSNKWHGGFAFAFFGCMVAVCELCARTTITLLPTEQLQDAYRRRYHAIAISLLLAPVAAVAVAYATDLPASLSLAKIPQRTTFFVEWFGVWIFAAYWMTKTAEFRITSAEEKALKGEVRKSKGFGLVEANTTDDQLTPKSRYEAALLAAK